MANALPEENQRSIRTKYAAAAGLIAVGFPTGRFRPKAGTNGNNKSTLKRARNAEICRSKHPFYSSITLCGARSYDLLERS